MKSTAAVRPEDLILSALSPEDRLEAALKIARVSFKNSSLTVENIEKAVKKVRRKAHETLLK